MRGSLKDAVKQKRRRVNESVCQPMFCVRARLQPCRNQRRINAALAAEVRFQAFSHRLVNPHQTQPPSMT